MKKASVLLLAVALGLCMFSVSFAEDFSADFKSVHRGQSMSGKLYVSGKNTRMEGGGSITITRTDKGVVWAIMPGEKSYMEMPIQGQQEGFGTDKFDGEVSRESLGKEIVEGIMAEKFRINTDVGGIKSTMLLWVAPGSQIPVKLAAEDNSWWQVYKNIKKGPQPSELFEVPSGLKKMASPFVSVDTLGGELLE